MKGRVQSQYAKPDFLNLVHLVELFLSNEYRILQSFQSLYTNFTVWMDNNLFNHSPSDAYLAFLFMLV